MNSLIAYVQKVGTVLASFSHCKTVEAYVQYKLEVTEEYDLKLNKEEKIKIINKKLANNKTIQTRH